MDERESVRRLQVLGRLAHDGDLRYAGGFAQVVGYRLGRGREDRAYHHVDLVALDQFPRLVDRDDRVGGVVLREVLERPPLPLVVEHGQSRLDALVGKLAVIGHEAGEPFVETELDGVPVAAPAVVAVVSLLPVEGAVVSVVAAVVCVLTGAGRVGPAARHHGHGCRHRRPRPASIPRVSYSYVPPNRLLAGLFPRLSMPSSFPGLKLFTHRRPDRWPSPIRWR